MVAQNEEPPQEKQPLSGEALAGLRENIPDWEVLMREGHNELERTFEFSDFAGALAFTNAVGEIAEAQDHHPTITTEWGAVTVTWWSHDAGGLTRRDIRAAEKTDERYDADA